jgi:hypothetical protein
MFITWNTLITIFLYDCLLTPYYNVKNINYYTLRIRSTIIIGWLLVMNLPNVLKYWMKHTKEYDIFDSRC